LVPLDDDVEVDEDDDVVEVAEDEEEVDDAPLSGEVEGFESGLASGESEPPFAAGAFSAPAPERESLR
jgi:hypothetical protein